MKRLVIIDGKSVFYRSYYAMGGLAMADGTPTGAIYGFAAMLIEIIDQLRPDYVAVAWDKPKTNIRRRLAIYPEYKAGRKPAPEDFYAQVPLLLKLLEAFHIPLYECDDFEADDIMGALSRKAEAVGVRVDLISGDLDMLQIVDEDTDMYQLKKGFSNVEKFDVAAVEAKYGLKKSQFLDLKSLKGDSSDNIPGVPGIGEKGAVKLLQEYESLDNIYANIEQIGGSVGKKLREGRELAYMSRELSRIMFDAPVEFSAKDTDLSGMDAGRVVEVLREFEFRSLVRKFEKVADSVAKNSGIRAGGIASVVVENSRLEAGGIASSLVENPEPEFAEHDFARVCQKVYIPRGAGKNSLRSDSLPAAGESDCLTGENQSSANSGSGFSSDALGDDFAELDIDAKKDTKLSIEDSLLNNSELNSHTQSDKPYDASRGTKTENDGDVKIKNHVLDENIYLSWDVKKDMHADKALADEIIAGRAFWDLGQAGFLLSPLGRRDEQMMLAMGDSRPQEYAEQLADFEKLPRLRQVAEELDFPLIAILYAMEMRGIKIDLLYFEQAAREFRAEIDEIERRIYEMVGHPFNINSPMQLSQVLYEELGLPTKGVKKKLRFYSTGQKELDKLRDLHPIVAEIERIREISKLLSTYILPLPQLADENGRVHTTYTQNVTATGRLSSVAPNLQNIPVRTEEGRRIRSGFVAEDGKIFVSADYAQFELRLAAALAGDKGLIEDFNSGIDIHTKTASDSFHVAMSEVSDGQRRAAKVINFGVLYGMSAKGLADATDMSVPEAKDFIARYFELRAPIRDYLDATLLQAREEGFVETWFGRRRPTPDVNSPNFLVRAGAERAAMNMPIQGTEADLMKVSMRRLVPLLPAGADLILQVHDSLVVECDESLEDAVGKILREVMEGVAPDLPIKLAVDLKIGKNWGEL